MNKKYFTLFANCVPVRGVTRTIICDLERGEYLFVPSVISDIVMMARVQPIEELLNNFSIELKSLVEEYLSKLVSEELGFYCNDPQLFPPLTLEWNSPCQITNAIIDMDKNSVLNFQEIAKQLDELRCIALQIRFFTTYPISTIMGWLSAFETSMLQSIELIINYDQFFDNIEHHIKFLNTFLRIRYVVLHSAPINHHYIYRDKGLGDIILMTQAITSDQHCGVVSPLYFQSNINLFTESHHYNSCLNRKISIDSQGFIRNCPSMKDSYGNIHDTTLVEALQKPGFKDIWNLTKDDILVCRDCEFRYICTDCRAFLQDKDNNRSKPAKCTYDPYKAVWVSKSISEF